MAPKSCTHCGAEIAPEQMLCGKCTDWLDNQTTLDEPTLIEALQFDSKPVPGGGAIMTTLAFTVLPLLVESLMALNLFTEVSPGSDVASPAPPNHQIAALILMASSFGSVIAVAVGTYLARSRPSRAMLVTGSIFAAMTAATGLAAWTIRITDYLFELRSLVVVRGIAVALFALPIVFAIHRQSKLKNGRKRLLALRNSGG